MISPVVRCGEVQRRSKRSGLEKEKTQNNGVNVGGKVRKKNVLPKDSIQQTDGAKYMSYLKVSYSLAFLTVF
jgi:hypothetical protein